MKLLLTKSNWFIIGWIALLLGFIMNGIFYGISAIGLPNVGLSIILFTILIYVAMTPLQIQQQRFSKLNNVMAPELQKVQAKYKGKKDQESQQRLMDETQAIYHKYGVSPSGSCLQLVIQMPILFALYQVIYKIPGYISLIGDKLTAMVNTNGFTDFFSNFLKGLNDNTLNQTLTSSPSTATYVDTLYKLNTSQWTNLITSAKGENFTDALSGVHNYVSQVTNFLGLNISDTPMTIFTSAWSTKTFILMFAAAIFPILAWFTQWMNYKLMPQPASTGEQNQMQNTMKTMNNFMPIMSAFFCFTLPVGVGIYWIAGAVVRSVQQILINKRLDSESMEELIKKNQEKMRKKRERKGLPASQINNNARISTRNLDAEKRANDRKTQINNSLKNAKDVSEPKRNYAEGSLASKANLVARLDEKNANSKHGNSKKK